MSKTITMMRMIVPIPMYMAVSSCSSQGQGRRFATCQQAFALPTVGPSKPAGARQARPGPRLSALGLT
jgi:hypothetical protein